jgi:hypothetical protein
VAECWFCHLRQFARHAKATTTTLRHYVKNQKPSRLYCQQTEPIKTQQQLQATTSKQLQQQQAKRTMKQCGVAFGVFIL